MPRRRDLLSFKRKGISRRSRVPVSKVSHSQTTRASQPRDLSSPSLRASRVMFASNLSAQNRARVFGVVVRGQPRCLCQKQPWTNTIFPRPGNTRSGVPGRSRACSRKRNPRECARRRTASSGFECFPLTRAISAERFGSTGPRTPPRFATCALRAPDLPDDFGMTHGNS